MFRNLVTSLLEHERVETTDAKAKEVRRVAERMITLGKRGDLHARRRAMMVIRRREVAAKVFDDLAERYRDRAGGYTRVLKIGHRVGDSAAVSVVELVDRDIALGKKVEKAAKRAKKAEEAAAPKKKKSTSRKASSAKETGKKTRTRKTASKKAASEKSPSKKDSAAKSPAKRKSTRRKTD
jgi:large subunit ribosomal protein L17